MHVRTGNHELKKTPEEAFRIRLATWHFEFSMITRTTGERTYFKVKTTPTHQTVDSDIFANRLDLGQVLIHYFGNRLQRLGSGLVSFVLATPLAADAVKAHGAIRERNSFEQSSG